ncbi:MAG: glycosyltransferase family 4 protein [Alphaproteobacteria bacterium]|jgi:glycosyltransferase involved in cell wall biosynthesis|nr:glycosyltransferase family 4 protein [Alphaproteobacteria bacterium]
MTDAAQKKKLLYVVNVDWAYLSHRKPLGLAARKAGFEVHLATRVTDRQKEIEAMGITVHPLPLDRGYAGPLEMLTSAKAMYDVYRKIQPDVVHLVTIKPVLLGGIAARLARVPKVVAAVPGLGYIFMSSGLKATFRRWAVILLYKLALSSSKVTVIFQNTDDRDTLLSHHIVHNDQVVMIKGSGVDLTEYRPTPEPEGTPVVVLPARLLADKGIYEFVEAARLVKGAGVSARFCLVGAIDTGNPTALKESEVTSWCQEGVIEHWGHRSDMPTVLEQANIVALPSYREGLPKALIEAAACARAVVTTDTSGCRDAILAGETGLLVPVKDAKALAEATKELITQPAKRHAMGTKGRRLAEETFDIQNVIQKHMVIYRGDEKRGP